MISAVKVGLESALGDKLGDVVVIGICAVGVILVIQYLEAVVEGTESQFAAKLQALNPF